MRIRGIDHLVLTVTDLEETCAFYQRVLGMEVITFGANRKALRFGRHKINLHQKGQEFEPKAALPTPGSADLCLIAEPPIDAVVAHLGRQGIAIEAGPVERLGAAGPMTSVYLRDPDRNLIEIASYG